jgi:Trypsin-like peptidase domain
MDLVATSAQVFRSVVALASLAVPERLLLGRSGGIPDVIGTGFLVDPRGIVMTAGHVARRLMALPKHPVTGRTSAIAILFDEPNRVGDALEMKPLWIDIRTYSLLETFTANENIFYGEAVPDLALVQLGVQGLPALSFNREPDIVRAGLAVAFAGFPFGSDGLLLRIEDHAPIVVQATPFLRHGIISSVHPFQCPNPHGFSIDAMSHGGASGSPIFQREDPRVLGMLYAAFEGEHRLTLALPGHLLYWATNTALSDGTVTFTNIPLLDDYKAADKALTVWLSKG